MNYHHLQNKVNGWVEGKSAAEVEELILTLRSGVRLLPLECMEEDDALELFQIVNDRGMHLGDADIFKAKIYREIGSSKTDKEDFIYRWGVLEDHDALFRAFMHISRADDNDTSKEIALRKYVSPKLKENWKKILRCLEVCSWAGGNVEMCDDETVQSNATIYWQILDCLPNKHWQYPLYVFVHKHAVGETGEFSLPEEAQEKYIALLKYTVRYFYIKGVVYNSVNAVKDTAYKACVEIDKGRDYAAVYQKSIDDGHDDMTAFLRKLKECDYGRCRNGLVLINSLLSDRQDPIAYAKVLLGKYHIEHILPRQWAHYDKWDKKSHAQAIDQIGNLIPLEPTINIQASNEFFQRKQEKYKDSQVSDAVELSEKKPAREGK